MKKKDVFSTGVHLLETITAGMYNDPLMIFREYIQNAVDSIDIATEKKSNKRFTINIKLDPINKSILIRDNAHGIDAHSAESYLSAIGASFKSGTSARGFRGIGRLGGIAFCNRLIFRTSGPRQKMVSEQSWDCIELRKILSQSHNNGHLSINKVLNQIVSFKQSKTKNINDSFFEVLLEEVYSYKNLLLDFQKVRKYITETAPIAFNKKEFEFARKVTTFLKKYVSGYRPYSISLNDHPLYKPYTNAVPVMKGADDTLTDIEFFEIKKEPNELLAVGWLGLREEMKGAIRRGDLRGGIRIRVGDIMLGNSFLLNDHFREPRFNHYCVGEIHLISKKLIPNGRRDDLIDNEYKGIFYNEFERVIGLPLSKEIRRRSINLELITEVSKDKSMANPPSPIIPHGTLNKIERKHKLKEIEDVLLECNDCEKVIRIKKKLLCTIK